MEKLFQYLDSISPLSESLQEHLLTVLKSRELPKKAYLLKAGRICSEISFIEEGLVRCFYLKQDKEICSWFMSEGDVIISVESFFRQQVSKEYIQALEDVTLHYITYNELQNAYRQFPQFNVIGRILTERYYCLCEQRLYSIRMQRASERYDYLIKNFPEIVRRVPSKYIASYLSITEETLSRIRSKT